MGTEGLPELALPAFAVPYARLQKNKKHLNMTERGERSYWHVPITTLDNGALAINMAGVGRSRSSRNNFVGSLRKSLDWPLYDRWSRSFDHPK